MSTYAATEFQLRLFLRRSCNCPLVHIVLVKFLEASVELETTRKYHPKNKDPIARSRKMLMASHNISFVLLSDKEFKSL